MIVALPGPFSYLFYSLLPCGLFYEAICCMSFHVSFCSCFFKPFSIAITSVGEEIANLSAFRTFVRFVLVRICRFPLPLGVWEGLRLLIVALPGLFSFFFMHLSHNIPAIANSFITVNKFSELLRKVRFTSKFFLNLYTKSP